MADPGNSKKILLVDDEPQVTHIVGSLLRRMGPDYQVLLALDKQKALELLKKENPHVILLDIDLHGIQSGLEILEIVNREYQNTKAIVITGRAKAHRGQIEKIGCYHFFEKPFELKELNDKIKEALGLENITEEKGVLVSKQKPKAKLLFIEPDLRHYAYLCSIFDAWEMLDGADYQVKVLDRMEDLLTQMAVYQPDIVLIGDYFLEERQLQAMIDLIQNDIKIKPKSVMVHSLFGRDELFKQKLQNKGIIYCMQNVMDNEEILQMNRKLADAVAQNCIEIGLVK